MPEENPPLMQFECNASAPILRYDIPSPSSYIGRNYIELNIENNIVNSSSVNNEIEFNQNAYTVDLKKIQENFLKTNKEVIVEYLTNSKKEDMEKDILLIFHPEELELFEETIEISYPATYTFSGLTTETITESEFLSEITLGQDSLVISPDLDDHKDILTIQDNVTFYHIFNSPVPKGTMELWCRAESGSQYGMTFMTNDDTSIIAIQIINGIVYYVNQNNLAIEIGPFSFDQWHHIRIEWFQDNSYDIWIDKIREIESQSFVTIPNNYNGIYKVMFTKIGSGNIYLDAIGSSSDEEYKIGENTGVVKLDSANIDKLKSIMNIRPTIQKSLELLHNIRDKSSDSFQRKFQLFRYLVDATINDSKYPLMPVFNRTMGGNLKLRFISIPLVDKKNEGSSLEKNIAVFPRLILIETFKLTTFPGDYGAGTTIKTFSLLPNESTKISIKTWKKTSESTKDASSILDSYTEDKADEFERSAQNENSRASKVEESLEYHLDANVNANWGWGSASVSAGVSGSTNSAREESVKNVMNTTEKHAQKASSKREVNIDTSYERTAEMVDETMIMREIENINSGRTLNFTFRQMNQQFHSILHLVDVRIAFYNGLPGSMKEYALYEIDELESDFLKKDLGMGEKLKEKILLEYSNILDFEGNIRKLVEKKEIIIEQENNNITGSSTYSYIRIIPPRKFIKKSEENNEENIILQGMQEYEMRNADPDNNQKRDVRYLEGVILGKKIITMKTDGIIVEALLGQANALDDFSLKTQEEKVREQKYTNDLMKAEYRKIIAGVNLINDLTEAKQYDKAISAYKDIFGVQEGLKYIGEIFNGNIMLTNK